MHARTHAQSPARTNKHTTIPYRLGKKKGPKPPTPSPAYSTKAADSIHPQHHLVRRPLPFLQAMHATVTPHSSPSLHPRAPNNFVVPATFLSSATIILIIGSLIRGHMPTFFVMRLHIQIQQRFARRVSPRICFSQELYRASSSCEYVNNPREN